MRRLASFACAGALLAACNGIVGIEDLYEGERPGDGGASSVGGKNGGSGGSGGSVIPEGGSDTQPGGGSAQSGEGPGPLGGDGTGGTPEPATGAVKGHVIDFWGKPVPSLLVQIGETQVSTDKDGAFTVPDVPAEYDVTMVYSDNDLFQVAAWAYLGLTRRDPTLQVYRGTDRRFGNLDVKLLPKPTLGANQRIDIAVGTGTGADTYDNVSVNGTSSESPLWFGAKQTAATGHGLLWQVDAQKLPVGYLSYASADITLDTANNTTLTLDLSAKSIASSKVPTTVTPAGVASRRNWLFLRFDSDATLKLGSETNAQDTFSYLAPTIAGSSLTVAASEGYTSEEYAVAHADNVKPGDEVKLTIPAPMIQQTPPEGTKNVTATTRFSFSGDEPGPYVSIFYSQDPDDPSAPATAFQSIYVVTAKKQFTLPTFLGGDLSLYANRRYIWVVTTHGAHASMDELADKGGYLDAFSWDEETPQGPRRESGTYTNSGLAQFWTAP